MAEPNFAADCGIKPLAAQMAPGFRAGCGSLRSD